MSRGLESTLALTAGILLVFSNWGMTDQPLSKDEQANKYRKLVAELVSPNEEPNTRNKSEGSVKFPKSYDVKAQDRIKVIRQTLCDNFEEGASLSDRTQSTMTITV